MTDKVTTDPQGPEQTSLDSFKGSPPEVTDAYIHVSDDNGNILGNIKMEEIAQNFCQILNKELSTDEAENILTNGKEFCKKYSSQINFADNTANGIITKYRLRWGMMLLLQKKALKKNIPSKKWEVWFADNHSRENKRSAQDYMRLAKIPNIIAFAILGKERLMALSRLIEAEYGKDFSGATNAADPLGEYLQKTNISFDFSKPGVPDEDELYTIDMLYLKKRLKGFAVKKGYNIDDLEVSDNALLGTVKSLSKPLSSQHFNNMFMVKRAGGNVETYINDTLLSSGSNTAPDVIFRRQTNRLPSFANLLTQILDYLNENQTASSEIALETIEAIEAKIKLLKDEISNNNQPE